MHEQLPSDWSPSALHALMLEADRRYEARFTAFVKAGEEADKRFEQRFIAQQEAIQAALLAQKEAVNAALVAADRAVGKAELASEKRFEGVNEFRATLADQAAQLMPRAEAESRIGALSDRIDTLATQHHREMAALRDELQKSIGAVALTQAGLQGRDRGVSLSWAVVSATIFLAIAIAGFALARGGP